MQRGERGTREVVTNIEDSFRADDVDISDEPIVFVYSLQKVSCFFCRCVRENDIIQPLAAFKPMTRIVVIVLMIIKMLIIIHIKSFMAIENTWIRNLFYIYFHHSCTGMHYHSRNTT